MSKGKQKKLGTCDNLSTPHPKMIEGEQFSSHCQNWVKLGKKKESLTASGGWSSSSQPLYDLFPKVTAQRGGITCANLKPEFTNRGGDHMRIKRVFEVLSLVAFGAGFLGSTLFGHSGVELLSGGLFLYAAGDLADEILG